jgi:hypothetical protein
MEDNSNGVEIDQSINEITNEFFEKMNIRRNKRVTKFNSAKLYEKFLKEVLKKWRYKRFRK